VRVPQAICSRNIVSIIVWNVAGELVSPKNITFGWKSPRLVINTALCRSSSTICTVLYPQRMSTTVISSASPILLINWGMSGRGYRFLMVHSLMGQ